MTTITNNELTDDVLEYVLAVVEDRYENRKSNAGEDDRIILALRELQERRKADNQEPASERERIRREHAEWSDATFGDVGPIGPLKHLSKEALEAAADPSEPLEWADMQFLLWDAQRRMGISDEFITRAMIEKLEINKSRQWPEPKDGEPRLHIKEQPAPAVIQSSQLLHDFYRAYADWLISGGDGQFSCVNGLCANLFDYCDRKGVGSAQALNEMHVQFVTAGMNEKLPFNTSVTDFDAESADGKCHLNTARRKWVFRRIIDGVKPALVVPDERAAFNAWNNEDNLPIAGVGAKNAAWLAWQARASLCGNSALNVPPERPADSSNGDDVEAWFDEGWNACRTAMLNGGKS